MNRFFKIHAVCAALLATFAGLPMFGQTIVDLTDSYQFPEWNECDNITLEGTEYSTYNGGGWSVDTQNPGTILADFVDMSTLTIGLNVENSSVLSFRTTDRTRSITIDGTLVYNENDFFNDQHTYWIDVPVGEHTVVITVFSSGSAAHARLRVSDIGVISTRNTRTVSLLEPGSLGTEILYLDGVNRIQDVRCLKVIGRMNDADLSTLNKMKDNLFYLDLSDAIFTEIPNNEFKEASFLHTVILPEGVNRIGTQAFYKSSLKRINFPSTLTTLGESCFCLSCISEAIINENCLNWEYDSRYNDKRSYTFEECYQLRKVVFPSGLKNIYMDCFHLCYNLYDFTLPESLETIGSAAFDRVNQLGLKEELVIPNGVTYLGASCFYGTGFRSVVLPMSISNLGGNSIFGGVGSSIREVRLESPSIVTVSDNPFNHINHSEITLYVPNFLLNYYKIADYWYDFGEIIGFETAGTREWIIRGNLILDAHNRWTDEPNTTLKETASMKVYGSDPLTLGDFTVESNLATGIYSRLMSNIDHFTVNGTLSANEYMQKNKWYYISLPFNMKVGDISFVNGTAQKAIRYYNGANRAENGTGCNWVNCTAETIIPAGTGFIFQTSVDGWWNFPSQEDESKAYISDFRMFVKELAENPSAIASNCGWNLVGNPYQTWYNIHKLNFSAPITVRNVNNNTYEAYSIIDDDYALAPNQAFFVQCPEGTTEISFPLNGRQMTSEITSQNGAPARYPVASSRVLVDLQLNDGESTDKTRVVLNQKASMQYETSCDASKFLSEENVAQVYTLDNEGTQYAINERPVQNGEIQLGIIIPADGKYSFSLLRNGADNVYIIDNETGETVEITDGAYEFYAKAGTDNQRFVMVVESGEATGISSANAEANGSCLKASGCYNLNGQKVADDFKGIVIKNGKKVLR